MKPQEFFIYSFYVLILLFQSTSYTISVATSLLRKLEKGKKVTLASNMTFEEVLDFVETRYQEHRSKGWLFIGALNSKRRPGVEARDFGGSTLGEFYRKHGKYSYLDYIYLIAYTPLVNRQLLVTFMHINHMNMYSLYYC